MMNVVDIAPAHCGTLMGVCNGFSSFAGFFVPLVTTFFTEEDPSDPANWRKLFFLRYVPKSSQQLGVWSLKLEPVIQSFFLSYLIVLKYPLKLNFRRATKWDDRTVSEC